MGIFLPSRFLAGRRIWCPDAASGECNADVADGLLLTVEVPAAIDAQCYIQDSHESGACMEELDLTETVTEFRLNRGEYPYGYYRFMHLFVGDDPEASVLAMRFANVLVGVGLLGAITAATPRGGRRPALLTAVGASVPLGWFLIGSVNPSAWAVVGVLGTFLALHAALMATGKRQWVLHALALISAAMACVARADSAAYSVVAAGVAILLQYRAVRARPVLLLTPAIIVAMAISAFMGAGQTAMFTDNPSASSLAATVLSADPPPIPGPATKLFHNIMEIPGFFFGVFGVNWGLGWLDTRMPSITSTGVTAVFVALLFLGSRAMNLHKGAAMLGVFGLAIFLPLYTLQNRGYWIGEWAQPRYTMPLVLLLLAISLTRRRGEPSIRMNGSQQAIIYTVLVAAHTFALHTNIRRYVTGLDVNIVDLAKTAEWWWDYGPGPNTVWLLGSVAFALFASAIFLAERPGAEESDPMLDSGPDSREPARSRRISAAPTTDTVEDLMAAHTETEDG